MIPLPGYVDKDAWEGFVEMRRKIKAPLTVRAATLILFELQRIKDAGHDPNASLDQSTMKCWRDVWPLKDKEIHRQARGTGELERMKTQVTRGPTEEEARKMRELRQRLRSVG